MRIRILLSLLVMMYTASLFAQSNDITLFANHSSFHSTSETDPTTGFIAKLKFDSKVGYGISFDHFLSPDLSIQLLAQQLKADTKLELTGAGTSVSEDAGTLDLKQYDVALHWYFLPANSSFRPYVGGGVARIQGGKLHIPADLSGSGSAAETVSLDSKTSWVADAGIDVRIARQAAISVTAKYTPYKTSFGAAPGDPVQRLKLDPLTLAAGLRWRF
jgi:outer membrane protein W